MNTATPTQIQNRVALLRRAEVFLANRDMAVRCAKKGDRDGARFWGVQARYDWRQISAVLTQPSL
jgi:hypothetical protein